MKKSLKFFLFLSFLATLVIFMFKITSVPEIPPEREELEQIEGIIVTASIKLQAITIRAYPEKRIPVTNNWGTILDFQVQEQSTHNLLFQRSVTSNNSGIGTINLLPAENIPSGINSIWIKGTSHLARRYNNMFFSDQYENFDFTPYGDLLAGDTHISNDNFVNSLDISTLINQLTTNNYKNDLNQDSIVNILDLDMQVDNISQGGDA